MNKKKTHPSAQVCDYNITEGEQDAEQERREQEKLLRELEGGIF